MSDRTRDGVAREHFAADVEAALLAREDVVSVSREAHFSLRAHDEEGGSVVHHLDALFHEMRELSADERRARIAAVFGERLVEIDEWRDARSAIVPVLRGATYGLEAALANPDARALGRPFLPFLEVFAVVDHPTTMAYVTQPSMDGWGVTAAEVWAAADATLATSMQGELSKYDDTHGPLWIISSDDTYESSRLLVPGWLAACAPLVEGRPIAIVPERAMVLVGGDARPEMVARLAELAEREFDASSRRVSPALYTVDDDGRVMPYLRAGHDALSEKVTLGHAQLALYEHGEQKHALDAHHEATNVDVFVATYRVVQTDDGDLISRAVWTENVETWLPQTDEVALVTELREDGTAERILLVPFSALRERMTAVDGARPARWATGTFPSRADLDALALAHPP